MNWKMFSGGLWLGFRLKSSKSAKLGPPLKFAQRVRPRLFGSTDYGESSAAAAGKSSAWWCTLCLTVD